MKKKIILLIVVVIFIAPYTFAELEVSPTINANQPLSPGDWIYKTNFEIAKVGWVNLILIYKGIEEEKVLIERIINVSYEIRSMTNAQELKLPLNPDKQTFLNKANSKSTLLLTIIDGHNRLKVEETTYRGKIPITYEETKQIWKTLESKIKEELSKSGYWDNRQRKHQAAGPDPEK